MTITASITSRGITRRKIASVRLADTEVVVGGPVNRRERRSMESRRSEMRWPGGAGCATPAARRLCAWHQWSARPMRALPTRGCSGERERLAFLRSARPERRGEVAAQDRGAREWVHPRPS